VSDSPGLLEIALLKYRDDAWYALEEIAEDFKISRSSVYRAKDRQHLEVIEIDGGIRTTGAAVKAWVRGGMKTRRRDGRGAKASSRPSLNKPFKHLDANRLDAAWRQQDADPDR
jgi:hypothetical protein